MPTSKKLEKKQQIEPLPKFKGNNKNKSRNL